MGEMTYTEFRLGDRPVAGGPGLPPEKSEVPSHWLVYFAVQDVDASDASAKALGASTIVEPTDIPAGRFSILRDPQGAVFGLLRMSG